MRLSTLVLVAAGAAVLVIIYRRGKTMARLSTNFLDSEFASRGRPLLLSTVDAYRALAAGPLEYARAAAAQVAGEPVRAVVSSGQRLLDHNNEVDGKGGSYHLPPELRAGPSRRNPGVAADVYFARIESGARLSGPEHAEVARLVVRGMESGAITKGGVHAYHTQPGATKLPFVHIDSRGYVASW